MVDQKVALMVVPMVCSMVDDLVERLVSRKAVYLVVRSAGDSVVQMVETMDVLSVDWWVDRWVENSVAWTAAYLVVQ